MSMSKTIQKTTPGGRSTEVDNPSSFMDGAAGQSDSGGPATCFVSLGSQEEVGGGERRENRSYDIESSQGSGFSEMPVSSSRWYRNRKIWKFIFVMVISLLWFITQLACNKLSVGSTVNPQIRHLNLRLSNTDNDIKDILMEVHALCKIFTRHKTCLEMAARNHNRTMHALNGNIRPGQSRKEDDPNPPAEQGLKGNEMQTKVNTVGPLHFPFDNEAAKRVQALVAHPLVEASSNNLGILNNHVRPSSHGMISTYSSTHWNTFNISSRAYIGYFFKLVPDRPDPTPAPKTNARDIDTVYDMLKRGLDFIVKYDNVSQVERAFNKDTAEKFETGKYEISVSGNVVMRRVANRMRHFTPNQVRRARNRIALELEESASRTSDEGLSDFVFVPSSTGKPGPSHDIDEPDPVEQTVWPLYSDKIPVRSLMVSSSNYETQAKPTYTPLKIAIDEINADKMGAGLSMNLVRGWNQTDINSLNLMVNKIGKSSDSFFEEAALVRVGCVLNAITPDAYSIDPTTRRFVRRVRQTWTPTETKISKFRTQQKGYNFIVTTTDIAGMYLRNKAFPATLNVPFKASSLDKDWTIIPIDPSKYGGKSIVAYIMAFLDSGLWHGSVNYTIDRVVKDETDTNVAVRYITMPTCNSVRIPGKKNFMLILSNSVGMNAPDYLLIGDRRCNVWKDYRVEPTMYDFAPIWYTYFAHDAAQDALEDLGMHLVRAWNVISDTMATMDTVGRAASVVAELSSNYTYGIARQHWTETGTANGAWTVGGGPLDPDDPGVLTNDIFQECWAAKNEPGRQRLVGYNFGYHSPWMSFPQSDARPEFRRLDESLNPKECEFSWSDLTYENPQYVIREATSFYRLCFVFGLIETTHQTLPMMTQYGFQNWINSHGILMAMSMVDFVNQSSIPPTSWFLCSESYDTLTSTTMSNANESITLGLAKPNRMEEVAEEELGEWGWNRIVNYYGFPYSDNEYDSMMPIGCSSLMQWLEKTNQKIPHPTLPTVVVKWVTAGAQTIHRAIGLQNTDRISAFIAGSCPDMMLTDYQVRVDWSCLDTARFAYLWCEQPEMETITNGEYNSSMRRTGRIVPQALVISRLAWPTQLNDVQKSWIIRSLSDDNTDMPPQCISPLILPDPIDWKAFLEGIRDWVIYPAAQGGLGYLAGGVPGAVVGAGASLLSKIQKESSGTTKNVIDPISTVAGQVNDAMLKEASKTGKTLSTPEVLEIAKSEVLKGPQEASQEGTSGHQPT